MYKSPYYRHLWYCQNHEPKKWSLFDIVGTYSIGTNLTLKVGLVPMETTKGIIKCLKKLECVTTKYYFFVNH